MSVRDDDPLEIEVQSALAEYFVRCDRGEAPDREAFLAKNESHARAVAELLDRCRLDRDACRAIGRRVTRRPSSEQTSDPNEETHPHDLKNVGSLSYDPNSATLPVIPTQLVHRYRLVLRRRAAASRRCLDPRLIAANSSLSLWRVCLGARVGTWRDGVVYSGHQVNLQRPVRSR